MIMQILKLKAGEPSPDGLYLHWISLDSLDALDSCNPRGLGDLLGLGFGLGLALQLGVKG